MKDGKKRMAGHRKKEMTKERSKQGARLLQRTTNGRDWCKELPGLNKMSKKGT